MKWWIDNKYVICSNITWYFDLLPLNPENSPSSSDQSSSSSQMTTSSSDQFSASYQMKRRRFSFLYPSASWWAFQPQANLNESSQNGLKLCRTIQTFEEEEKLFLVERPVVVGDMVPKFSSLSPSSSFLVQIPFVGDLGQGHPWLKLTY